MFESYTTWDDCFPSRRGDPARSNDIGKSSFAMSLRHLSKRFGQQGDPSPGSTKKLSINLSAAAKRYDLFGKVYFV